MMTSIPNNIPASRTVTILNALLSVLLLALSYKQFIDQKSLMALTGRDLGVAAFISDNAHRLALQCAIVAMLLLGLILELRRSRVAWVGHIGGPLLALAVLGV